MNDIRRFEDLKAWQEARKLAQMVFAICKTNSKEFSLTDQIKRSVISVMANTAEGFGRYSIKDAKQFYTLSRGSLAETQSHLYVFKDMGLLEAEDFDKIYVQATYVNKLINGLITNALKQIGTSIEG
jgi:four helix bundle protein